MASTEKGHCQICGRQFAVRSGRIASHGFTRLGAGASVQGNCPGSFAPPSELSTAMRARWEAQQAELKANRA